MPGWNWPFVVLICIANMLLSEGRKIETLKVAFCFLYNGHLSEKSKSQLKKRQWRKIWVFISMWSILQEKINRELMEFSQKSKIICIEKVIKVEKINISCCGFCKISPVAVIEPSVSCVLQGNISVITYRSESYTKYVSPRSMHPENLYHH